MNIDSLFPFKFVEKDGRLTQEAYQFLSNLITQLQTNLNSQGFQMPVVPAATIAQLTNVKNAGAIMYDQNNNLFKGNVNGTIKTFTLT